MHMRRKRANSTEKDRKMGRNKDEKEIYNFSTSIWIVAMETYFALVSTWTSRNSGVFVFQNM